MRKDKLRIKIIIGILIIALCVIAAIFAFGDKGNAVEENGELKISSDGEVIGTVTLEEIKKLPSSKRRLLVNSTEGSSTHDFRGTLLSNILNYVNTDLLTKYDTVTAIGADGYESQILMDEVLQENSVFVMYADGEKPILTQKGEPKAMRVVILNDQFGQRFTNYLVEVVLE